MKNFAIQTAEKVGVYLLEHFRKDPELLGRRGTAKEITTQYDKGSDRIIVEAITKAYPSHNLITEESGRYERGGEYTWIVDSLDGSSNFAMGNPLFSISLALMHGEAIELGVIYAPFLDELYVAERGVGAFRNGRPIRVSDLADISHSYAVSCEGGDSTNAQVAGLNALIHPRVKDLRKLGSAALEAAWVASGRVEVYFTTQINEWDVAAGVLLVEEAGGKVTDFEGQPWRPVIGDYLFTNGRNHDEWLQLIRSKG